MVKGIVNVFVFDLWMCGKQDVVKNFGVNINLFSDILDVWLNVMNNELKVNDMMNQVVNSDLVVKDVMLIGNVVWKVFKKINGIDDEYCMVIMLMVGMVIFLMINNGLIFVFLIILLC